MGSCLLARLQQRCIFVETVKNDFRLNVSVDKHKFIRRRFIVGVKRDVVLIFEGAENLLFHSGRFLIDETDAILRAHFCSW